MENHIDDDHSGPDCPQCQAASLACQVMGGYAEAMQKMLDDGVFERMGEEMARRKEEAFLRAILSQPEGEAG
jgi:hypothetical protein